MAGDGVTPDFVVHVGGEVRQRRQRAEMTVQELADAAGVSRRMLTQIELGQANPSLVTVDKIARALGTDFPSLAREAGRDPLSVNAPGSAAGVWSSTAGSRATLQVATVDSHPAELWEWTLQPGDRYDARPDPAGSQELFFVISGQLTIDVTGMAAVVVKAGGSARLASDRQYSYRNDGGRAARFVRVVQLGSAP